MKRFLINRGFRALKLLTFCKAAFAGLMLVLVGCSPQVRFRREGVNLLSATVGPASAAHSLLTVSSPTVASGATVLVTLRALDSAGNPLTQGGDTVVFSHAGGASTGTFSAVADLGNGTYTATFTGGTVGTATTLNATINGVAVSSTLPTVSVTSGVLNVAQSLLTSSAATVASGSSVVITFRARDASGNNLSTGGATVAFSHSSGTSTGTFSAVTDQGDGTYTANFTGVASGTATTINATVNGSAFTGTQPTVTVTSGASSLAQSTITLSSATVVSGSTVTVTLTVRDAAGNAVTTGGATVAFSLTGAGTSTGTFSAVTDNGNGTYTATLTGVLAGTAKTVSGTLNGSAITSTLPTITVNPGSISVATSTISVSQATIQSGNTSTLTLQAKDAAGNNLSSGGATVAFSHSGGTSTGTISAVTDNGNGTYTATFTGVVSGTATSIGATIGGSNVTTSQPTITVTPGSYSLANSTVAVSDGSILVGETSTVTVTARDAANNRITTGGLTVTVGRSGGTSNGTFGSVTDVGDGTYTAVFTATSAGTATTITATIAAQAITSSLPTIDVDPLPPAGSKTTIAKSCGASIVSNATCTFTITARDANNNLVGVGGATVTISHSGGTSTLTFGSITDNGDGTYTVVGTGIVSGTATTIGGTINAENITTTLPTVSVTVGALSLSGSTISYAPESSILPLPSAYTLFKRDIPKWIGLQARDVNGNAITSGADGRTVTLGLSGGTSGFTTSPLTPAHNQGWGHYLALIEGTTVGTAKTFSASVDSGSPSGAVTSTMPTIEVKEPWVLGDLPGIKTPVKIQVRNNKVYIAENGEACRLQIRDTSGNYIRSIGHDGCNLHYWGWTSSPFGVAVDSTGRIVDIQDFGQLYAYTPTLKPLYGIGTLSQYNQGGDFHPGNDNLIATAVSSHHKVCISPLNASGMVNYCTSSLGTGTSGTADGQFNGPYDVAIDSSGNYYVADTGNNRIQKFNSSGVFVAKTGSAGSAAGQFNSPKGIAIDHTTGRLFVADTGNHRIQEFDINFNFIAAYANSGASGTGNGELKAPEDVASDSSTGDIWIADTGNNRIVKLDSMGGYLATYGQNFDSDSAFGDINGIGSGADGSVYIPDTTFNKVKVYDKDGNFVRSFGSAGSGNGEFNGPTDAAALSDGRIVVVDRGNHRVQVFLSDGTYSFQWGSFGTGNSQFGNPWGVAVDASDNIYVTDADNNKVKVFTSGGSYSWSFTHASINEPRGLDLDSSGNIYVSDWGDRQVRKYNSSGVYQSIIAPFGSGTTQVDRVFDLAVDRTNNRVYVTSYNVPNRGTIKVYSTSGTHLSNTCGRNFRDRNIMGYSYLYAPKGVAVDPTTGRYYVGDSGNHRIIKREFGSCDPIAR